jgi:hypothetical protein
LPLCFFIRLPLVAGDAAKLRLTVFAPAVDDPMATRANTLRGSHAPLGRETVLGP